MISKKKSVKVTEKSLEEFLGVAEVPLRRDRERASGSALSPSAWTDVGGELLTIEGVMMPGKGKMTVTGNLRDVIRSRFRRRHPMSARVRRLRDRAPLFDGATSTSTCPRGDPEGWTVSRLFDGDCDCFDHDRHSGPARCLP